MDFIKHPLKWYYDQLINYFSVPNFVGVGYMNPQCSFHNFQADVDLTQN